MRLPVSQGSNELATIDLTESTVRVRKRLESKFLDCSLDLEKPRQVRSMKKKSSLRECLFFKERFQNQVKISGLKLQNQK